MALAYPSCISSSCRAVSTLLDLYTSILTIILHFATDCKILKDDTPSKADLGISLPTDYIFPISGPTLTPGEDAYTLMNPAGTLTSSMEQNHHGASSKSTENLPLDGIPSHVRIRPSYSLPLEGIAGNISGDNGTPEERYVRHSLLT